VLVHGCTGLVTAGELRKLLSDCDSALDSCTIEDSFEEFDQDHTGKIGFYQFLRMFRQHLIDLEVCCPGHRVFCNSAVQPVLAAFGDRAARGAQCIGRKPEAKLTAQACIAVGGGLPAQAGTGRVHH
jgi:hypothetical protein